VNRKEFYSVFEMDVYEQFAGVWDALEEWNLVEVTPEKISLVGDGPFYTPLIQTLLAEQRYRQLRDKVVRQTKSAELSLAG
jgi:oxygen-independent coproporphyrinogen-3 oxidase